MNINISQKVQYGMFIVSTEFKDRKNGQLANTFFQITAEPPRFAVSLSKENLTHDLITKSKIFSVSILTQETPMTFIGTFGFKSGRDINKFENLDFFTGVTGSPVIKDHSLGFIECKVNQQIDCDTHTLFIGEMLDGEIWEEKDSPLTYAYYHQIKGGKTPKTATHYIAESSNKILDNKQMENKMDTYICNVCGYVYDPKDGDPDNGIAPGTTFQDIPENWVCPLCGVGKEDFDKE